MSKSNLVKYLKEFVVSDRRELFEEKIKQRTKHITIVLENIFQGRNISASIRSADCFGVQDVHIIENDNIFNDDLDVSLGAEKWITVKRYNKETNNSTDTINMLKSQGYEIVATTPHNANCNLYDLDISLKKIALIFGSEVNGCSNEILKIADKKMKIPMYGFTESFNISVSVSLCLQHLTYQQRKKNKRWQMSEENRDIVMLQWLRNSIKSSAEIEKKFLKL